MILTFKHIPMILWLTLNHIPSGPFRHRHRAAIRIGPNVGDGLPPDPDGSPGSLCWLRNCNFSETVFVFGEFEAKSLSCLVSHSWLRC